VAFLLSMRTQVCLNGIRTTAHGPNPIEQNSRVNLLYAEI